MAGQAAFGIYTSRAAGEYAVQALKAAAYRHTDISILCPQTASPPLVTGGTLGWLSGIGVLTIPGIGPFIAAGPIVEALARTGTLIGALIHVGLTESEAKRFEEEIKAGGILLSVHCTNAAWTTGARVILERTGGRDIAAIGEAEVDRKAS
jgi:hypothetical protein